MQHRTLIGLSFLGFASLMSAACTNAEPTMRNVTGTVPASDNVTSVVAMEVGNVSNVVSAPVDASGHFSITLPIGQRFYITFKSNDQTVGALRYMSSTGSYKSAINVTHAPNVSPTLKPASEDGAEAEDEAEDADDDDDGIEDDEIELGDVDNPAGDDKYEPSQNPEHECDSDGDGEDDFDDDGEDAEGADDDDSDADGLPDVIDTDDDGDGLPDV